MSYRRSAPPARVIPANKFEAGFGTGVGKPSTACPCTTPWPKVFPVIEVDAGRTVDVWWGIALQSHWTLPRRTAKFPHLTERNPARGETDHDDE